MTLIAAVGQAQALDGREAGMKAMHDALNQLGAHTPSLAIVIASQNYDAAQVLGGISSLLGDTPIIGFSSPATLAAGGKQESSVAIALLSSNEIDVEAHWLSGYAQSGRDTATNLLQLASGKSASDQTMLIFADGFNGDAEQMCLAMTGEDITLAGALSSGDPQNGQSFQMAGNQTGSGSLAAALLSGNIQVGIGSDHGWRPIGSQFRVTRSRGFWIRTLDGRPTSEAYAQLFGYPARDWGFPPLNTLVRLYPLGIDQGDDMLIRSPLRVEADGSFRMNAPVRDGTDCLAAAQRAAQKALLSIGKTKPAFCAARCAAQKALLSIGKTKPAFALVLVDTAWQMLLKAQPGAEINAIREVLGDDIPIIGGYTLGQIVPGKNESPPQFLNQHIVVMVFGEPEENN